LRNAGAVSAIGETAAGYAALTLMPAGTGVLTTEFKINLLAPPQASTSLLVGAWTYPHFGPSRGVREYRRTRKADRSPHCDPYGYQRA